MRFISLRHSTFTAAWAMSIAATSLGRWSAGDGPAVDLALLARPAGQGLFEAANVAVPAKRVRQRGVELVFGPLAEQEGMENVFGPGKVLFVMRSATIICLGTFITALPWRAPWIVAGIAWVMRRTRATADAGLGANVFMGQTEAPLIMALPRRHDAQ